MGDTVFCTSLAGDELARLHTWGTHPARHADYALASPCLHIDLPQTYFEPILVRAAGERGSRLRFNTEFLSFEQDADGVTATVQDRLDGSTYEIRAKYLVGADGGRSVIAEQLGLPFGGQADVAGSMNIVFKADLSTLVAHRPSVLYWIMSAGARHGRDRHGPRAHGPALERVADRVGLRHQRPRARGGRGARHRDRAQAHRDR